MRLGVNVDHVATVRQARGESFPDPVEAAFLCERAGADSIVMHLREDRRHIQDKDLFRAKEKLRIKLNMEMSIEPSVMCVALALKPDQCTLVPEKRRERTTESGLDVLANYARLEKAVHKLKAKSIEVSLFVDPSAKQIEAARRMRVPAIELHTGTFANQKTSAGLLRELKRLATACKLANESGIVCHAGHGLNYQNVKFMHRVKGLDELNIGYSIVSRALWIGMPEAVKEMKRLIR